MVRVDTSRPVRGQRSKRSEEISVHHHKRPASPPRVRPRRVKQKPEQETELYQAEPAVKRWWNGLWPEAQRLLISIPVLALVVWAVVDSGRTDDGGGQVSPPPTAAAAPATTPNPAAAPSAIAAPSASGAPAAPTPAVPDPAAGTFEERGAAFVAALDPGRVTTWDQLAECESSGDWSANTGNGYYGGLQFSPQTWSSFGGEGEPHLASREAQIMVAEQILAAQGWGAWPACSAKLGLR